MDRFQKQIDSLKRRLSNYELDERTGCWEWKGCKSQGGYGVIGTCIEGRTSTFTHRAAWIVENGLIPNGMLVCHHCDNPACVNPNHLWLGSPTDNIKDMVTKQRHNPARKDPMLKEAQQALLHSERKRRKCITYMKTLFDKYELTNDEILQVLEEFKHK